MKWGLKCGEKNTLFCMPHEVDIGACANIVIRLTHSIPRNLNLKIFFDSFPTLLKTVLCVYSEKLSIIELEKLNAQQLTFTKRCFSAGIFDKYG